MFPVQLRVFVGDLGAATVLLIFRHVRHALCCVAFAANNRELVVFSMDWLSQLVFPAGAQGLGGLLLAGADRLLRISAAMHGRRTEL